VVRQNPSAILEPDERIVDAALAVGDRGNGPLCVHRQHVVLERPLFDVPDRLADRDTVTRSTGRNEAKRA
jgi:hypothetical protein